MILPVTNIMDVGTGGAELGEWSKQIGPKISWRFKFVPLVKNRRTEWLWDQA
jgi:hypothetical protein